MTISLRDVNEADLPIFFEQQLDPEANHMAAFTSKDPTDKDAFMSHWNKILANDGITKKTILSHESIAGHIAGFERGGEPEITYWIGKDFWGKGVATQALLTFLEEFKQRPLYARVAKDNLASLRVLEKCDFIITGEGKGFANARGKETEEYILKLQK